MTRQHTSISHDDSIKHHYVPRSILRNFSVDGRQAQVYVFDKATGRSFVNSIEDAGSERYFNTVEVDGRVRSFEGFFNQDDGQLAHLIKRLEQERTVACLDAAQRRTLARVVTLQFLRTKMPRTTVRSTMLHLRDTLSEAGFDPEQVQNCSIPTEAEIRRTALKMLLDADDLASAIEAKRAFLVCSEDANQPFWTSDNPVAIQQTFPYGELGLNARGVEIYLPISQDLELAFYCPSIELQLERALAAPHPGIDREKFSEIYRGLRTGAAVSLGPGTSRFLNELQVLRSSRFIYGATADFALAKSTVARVPQARTIDSLVQVGKMGEGSPRRHGMPSGLCVVFYGRRDHHALRIESWDENEDEFLLVTSRDLETLQRIRSDEPLEQAVLYEDGWEMHGMREVRLEVTEGDPAEVRVLHRNEGLNQLMRTLGEQRRREN